MAIGGGGGGCLTVLNVAEKPSVARALASVFSQSPGSRDLPPIRGQAAQIFAIENVSFPHVISQGRGITMNTNIRPHKMIVTSVRGHLASQDFPPNYGWNACPPSALFEAPIETFYKSDMEPLQRMLTTQSRTVDAIILWLDCDREGEAICDEVRTVCLESNPRLRDKIYRAKFSTVLPQEIHRALKTLGRVNEYFVQAVQARSDHDLRVGAAFTRFQTLRLQKNFDEFADGSMGVVSYGPCQFPTLGFVVERWARIETFIPEDFWYIDMSVTLNDTAEGNAGQSESNDAQEMQHRSSNHNAYTSNNNRPIFLKWKRERLYDRVITLALYESCIDAEYATVVSLQGRPKNKWRPVPLATVDLQKRASRYLRIGSETLMTAAEELYQQGLISYPRTETEKFRQEFEHFPLIESFQVIDGEFGEYSTKLLRDNNFQNPRAGQHDDNAHPPITPCKAVDPQTIPDQNQRKVYTLIVKHYLACCSRDAMGKETVLTVKMSSEEFTAKGLMIIERNWLEIYSPWERWSTGQGELPNVQVGSRIRPTTLLMKDGRTAPPQPISEVELITLMDKNGIGTDATIAQHITTIQDRAYAVKDGQQKFLPTKLGIALVEGYNSMGYQLNRPDLRREMEAECNAVAAGRKRKEEIMGPILAKMLECLNRANAEAHKLDDAVARHFTRIGSNDTNSNVLNPRFSTCGGCGGLTSLKELRSFDQQRNNNRNNGNNNPRAQPKLVHCATCSIGLKLPSKGIPSPSTTNNRPVSCPICNYQVIQISQGDGYNGNGYQICPRCFSNAPEEFGGSSTSGEFRCFNCTHPTCSLSGGTRGGDVEVFPCPFCESSGTSGKITLRKNSRGYTLSCSNYTTTGQRARCEFTVWLPREANTISVPENNVAQNGNNRNPSICSQCSGENKIVRKLLFRWKPNSVPPGFAREHLGCVLCDEVLKSDFRVSIPQLNQVQRRSRQQSTNGTNASAGCRGRRNNSNSRSRSRQRSFNNVNSNAAQGDSASNPVTCFRCGQVGHYSSSCPNQR